MASPKLSEIQKIDLIIQQGLLMKAVREARTIIDQLIKDRLERIFVFALLAAKALIYATSSVEQKTFYDAKAYINLVNQAYGSSMEEEDKAKILLAKLYLTTDQYNLSEEIIAQLAERKEYTITPDVLIEIRQILAELHFKLNKPDEAYIYIVKANELINSSPIAMSYYLLKSWLIELEYIIFQSDIQNTDLTKIQNLLDEITGWLYADHTPNTYYIDKAYTSLYSFIFYVQTDKKAANRAWAKYQQLIRNFDPELKQKLNLVLTKKFDERSSNIDGISQPFGKL